MYWILFIGIALISYLVQANLKNKFEKYSKMPLMNGMTGRDVAIKMLHDNGIYDVKVTSTPGMLTDHYNPANKTVNLSEGVYGSNSVAAAAVAAHECGHAVQHARAYAPLKMRSAIIHCELGVVGRYPDGAIHASDSVGRYRAFCCYYLVQLHHSSGGNQCQPACLGLDEPCGYYQCIQS